MIYRGQPERDVGERVREGGGKREENEVKGLVIREEELVGVAVEVLAWLLLLLLVVMVVGGRSEGILKTPPNKQEQL